MFILYALSFALSGVCALTYQVAWARLFVGEFGATSGATATVLAAFMGGLALGSLFFGRAADKAPRPLRLYGLLECAVAVFALALPGLLELVGPWLQSLLASGGASAPQSTARALRFVAAFAILLLPTICMGGTFPVLAAAWGSDESRGSRWAFLYGANTLGAAIGALGAGFWWISAWGVEGTIQAAAWANLAVGMGAIALATLVRPSPAALPGSSFDSAPPNGWRGLAQDGRGRGSVETGSAFSAPCERARGTAEPGPPAPALPALRERARGTTESATSSESPSPDRWWDLAHEERERGTTGSGAHGVETVRPERGACGASPESKGVAADGASTRPPAPRYARRTDGGLLERGGAPIILSEPASVRRASRRISAGGFPFLLLIAAAIFGFVGLSLEVVWHRILGVTVVNTSYSFSIMLTVFLAALALGSVAASAAMHFGARPRVLLGTAAQLLACGILLGMILLQHPNTVPGTHLSSLGGERWNQYLSGIWLDAFLALFVPAFCLGMTFPLLCAEAAAARPQRDGRTLGGVTAANTIGAVAGSLLTGFVLIPWIGDFQSLLTALAVLVALLGLLLVREAEGWKRLKPAVVGLALLVTFAFEYTRLPESHALTMANGMLGGKRGDRFVCVDYREGASLTVGVLQSRDGAQRVLYTNSFAMAGTGPDYAYMRMLAHLPMMTVPAASSACVIGFGTGTTAGTLSLYPLRTLDVVEIAPEVVDMAKWFEKENHGVALRLARQTEAGSLRAGGDQDPALPAKPDTDIRLIIEDGAHFLRTTERRYDVITAEPPLPALAGSANLYGADFYRAALDRLTPEGVVCQWVPLHGVSPSDFKMLLRTFAQSFPHTSLWYFREAAVLLGGRSPWNFEPSWVEATLSLPDVESDLKAIDVADPYAILSAFVCADRRLRELAGDGPLVTLDRPRCEFFQRDTSLRAAHWRNLKAIFESAESVLPYVESPVGIGDRWTQEDVFVRWEGSMESLRAGRRKWYEAEEKDLNNDSQAASRARQEASGLYERAVRMLPAHLMARRLFEEAAPCVGRAVQAKALLDGLPPSDITKPSIIAKMLEAVQHGGARARERAIRDLSLYREPRLQPCFVEFLGHADVNVRLQSVWALEAYRGCPGTVAAVEKALRDPEWPVRQAAAKVLGNLREKSATASLVAALDDSEAAVRETALRSLEALTGAKDLHYDVGGDETVRSAGLERWKTWQRGRGR